MEFEVSYTLENEQQFWDELDEIVSIQCQEHELIDNALRSYLAFATTYKGEYLHTEYDIARCSYRLIQSTLFTAHKDYVRRQIVYSLLQEESYNTLHVIAAFLLYDGRHDEALFEMMNEEGAFPRILELIQDGQDGDSGIRRILLELLYEMSRIQRLRVEDLSQIDVPVWRHDYDADTPAVLIEDDFITSMFQIIEGLSDDVNDPYHYPVIRVLLILNEQYMVCAHEPRPYPSDSPGTPLTNKVIKILATHGPAYKSFGQNIILLLNRESETSLQLLILKLLYLLFTSPPTYEYFYTNDLHVLLDIILRNLLDLAPSSSALRHTYLRVLYPFLSHTQLRQPPHYKRDDVSRLLAVMDGGTIGHFGAIDETTKRLVSRCSKVSWLCDDASDVEMEGKSGMKSKQRLLSVGAMRSAMESAEVVGQESLARQITTDPEREGDKATGASGRECEAKGMEKSPFDGEEEF